MKLDLRREFRVSITLRPQENGPYSLLAILKWSRVLYSEVSPFSERSPTVELQFNLLEGCSLLIHL